MAADYTATITVEQAPEIVFNSINNVSGWWGDWWGGKVEGTAGAPGAEFTYAVPEVHYCKMKVTELIPDKKIVWRVLDADLSFTDKKDEWKDTDIVFEITKKGNLTEMRFTHIGLQPDLECYGNCSDGWEMLINESLKTLITTGKEHPDKKKGIKTMEEHDFATSIIVDRSPEEVFNAVNNVRGWWSEEIEGSTDKPGAEFKFHYRDVHRSTMKITEFIPNRKVVWLVTDNYFDFVKDQSEWIGSKVSFEIFPEGNKTRLQFKHIGLLPAHECYGICSDAWTGYIQNSLRMLITEGKGKPNPKED